MTSGLFIVIIFILSIFGIALEVVNYIDRRRKIKLIEDIIQGKKEYEGPIFKPQIYLSKINYDPARFLTRYLKNNDIFAEYKRRKSIGYLKDTGVAGYTGLPNYLIIEKGVPRIGRYFAEFGSEFSAYDDSSYQLWMFRDESMTLNIGEGAIGVKHNFKPFLELDFLVIEENLLKEGYQLVRQEGKNIFIYWKK